MMFSLILAEDGASLEGQQTTKKILHIGGDDWRSFVQYNFWPRFILVARHLCNAILSTRYSNAKCVKRRFRKIRIQSISKCEMRLLYVATYRFVVYLKKELSSARPKQDVEVCASIMRMIRVAHPLVTRVF